MDQIKLQNPLVIIVVGLPGSGKSFFAAQFAKTFGAALVSQDKIRWTLFANHTYSDNENSMVLLIANLFISELLRTKQTFVLDGGYETKESRRSLSRVAAKAGYKILTVEIQVDQPTAKRRALKRSAKNAGDKYKQSLTESEFKSMAKKYNAPDQTDKNIVVVSGKYTYSTQARTVLKKIVELGAIKPQISVARPVDSSPKSSIARSRGPFVQ